MMAKRVQRASHFSMLLGTKHHEFQPGPTFYSEHFLPGLRPLGSESQVYCPVSSHLGLVSSLRVRTTPSCVRVLSDIL